MARSLGLARGSPCDPKQEVQTGCGLIESWCADTRRVTPTRDWSRTATVHSSSPHSPGTALCDTGSTRVMGRTCLEWTHQVSLGSVIRCRTQGSQTCLLTPVVWMCVFVCRGAGSRRKVLSPAADGRADYAEVTRDEDEGMYAQNVLV
jgi:hypothetical protein